MEISTLEHIINLPLAQIVGELRGGRVSAVQLNAAYLDRIERLNPLLQAYITVTAEVAERQAWEADRALAQGHILGPLHGVPIAVKDLCETDFAPTSNGMALFRYRETNYQSAVMAALINAGAVCLGKLSMAEGACSTHHPNMPVPINPWGSSFRCGSSSSGSGVAVAARLCAAAIGSDTGGSIRFPSAYCGVTGLKPSRDAVSRDGILPMAPSLDHIGPMALDAAGCALVFKAIASSDVLQRKKRLPPVGRSPDSIGSKVVGYDPSLLDGALAGEIEDAFRRLLRDLCLLGIKLVPVTPPKTPDLGAVWTTICTYEVAQSHAESFAVARDEYGSALASMIQQGLTVSRTEYMCAMTDKEAATIAWSALFDDVDAIALPIHAAPPPLLDNKLGAPSAGDDNPLKYTASANVTGLPSLALPAGRDARGCPMGMQLLGHIGDDTALLHLGEQLQLRDGWKVDWAPDPEGEMEIGTK